MTRSEIVRRARRLIGTPFRPQGRSIETGLDCVGLVLAAYRIPGAEVRRDYRLRGAFGPELWREIGRFFTAAEVRARPGDLLLCAVADLQWHLAVYCGGSFVHADASARRAVETPGIPKWPIAGTFRRRGTCEEVKSWQP